MRRLKQYKHISIVQYSKDYYKIYTGNNCVTTHCPVKALRFFAAEVKSENTVHPFS